MANFPQGTDSDYDPYPISNDYKPPVKYKYPWRFMQVGDSIPFPNRMELRRARSAAQAYRKRNPEFRIASCSKQMRIWRV